MASLALTGLAALAVALVLANIWLVLGNQPRQAEVNQRQQFINQTTQMSRLNEGLVRAIATAAVTTNDDALRGLLTEQGINVTFTPNAAAAAAPIVAPALAAPPVAIPSTTAAVPPPIAAAPPSPKR